MVIQSNSKQDWIHGYPHRVQMAGAVIKTLSIWERAVVIQQTDQPTDGPTDIVTKRVTESLPHD